MAEQSNSNNSETLDDIIKRIRAGNYDQTDVLKAIQKLDSDTRFLMVWDGLGNNNSSAVDSRLKGREGLVKLVEDENIKKELTASVPKWND